ncbi:MAG TPA: ABC transporter permease [Longimicrobiales bacterium]|nr:ABC transporter permease [Longimicrobiales bacterium]
MREWLDAVEQRLRAARLDGAAERDIAEELAQHLADRYDELRRGGTSPEEARVLVLAELDEGDALAERVRQVVRTRPEPLPLGRPTFEGRIDGVLRDFRHGARALGRSPVYTLVAALVIALGIGASTVIFSVVNALLLRPAVGVHEPERLAVVYTSDYSGPRFGASSYPDIAAIAASGQGFEAIAAYTIQSFIVAGEGWRVNGLGEVVSANYFDVLGVRPALGRFFSAEESDAGPTAAVAVISHELWQSRLGGRPDAIGSTVRLAGEPLTVIGVAPRKFAGSMRGFGASVWVPLSAGRDLLGEDIANRGSRSFLTIGRLRQGMTVDRAQLELRVVAARLHAEFPEHWTDINERSREFTVLSEADARLPQQVRGAVIGFLGLLSAAVLMVLLIVCTNIANLMLSRASARRSEMGVRLALGATRGRIARHLLAESVLLAALGGTAGVLLAFWLTDVLGAFRLASVPVALDVPLDWRVLAFATGLTFATGILFGLAPALQASRAAAPLMREGPRATGGTRVRRGLIIVQVVASLVLLVAGGLFLRSLRVAGGLDTGYERERSIVLARFQLDMEGYTEERATAFYEQALERAGALPGTVSHTLVERVPLGTSWARRWIVVEGYQASAGEDMEIPMNGVAPGYFATMGVPLARGRDFSDADRAGRPEVVIVSEAFARRYWPTGGALGGRVSLSGAEGPYAEVIGIASDAKYRTLVEDVQPYLYYPWRQRPSISMTLVVRTAGDPERFAAALRTQLAGIAPAIAPPVVDTFRQHLALALLPQRVAAMLLSALGLLALAIAAVGLYGIIAFTVTQRAREFAIRIALGAAARQVRALVIRDALKLIGTGVLIGVPVAAALAMLVRGFLIVPPIDPLTYVAVALLLALCGLLASYAPARRATAQDPASTLRSE